MIYELRNSRTGERAVDHPTTVEIKEENGELIFTFTAKNTRYFCPYENYNDIHSYGDACEVLIGSDPNRKEYYEIEISPKNGLMLARMTYRGIDPNSPDGEPILDIGFVEKGDCFVKGKTQITEEGYIAELRVRQDRVSADGGEIYFNAYRLETEGGELNKHLFALNPVMRTWFHTPEKYLWLKDYL